MRRFELSPFFDVPMMLGRRSLLEDPFIIASLREFNSGSIKSMKCDVKETEEGYQIEAELPGFKKEEIKVEVEEGCLTITAETSSEQEENQEKGYIRRERRFGKVSRSFNFEDISEDKISAKYDNGILNIIIPKEEKKSNKVGITVE